jgi:hypothetical protein
MKSRKNRASRINDGLPCGRLHSYGRSFDLLLDLFSLFFYTYHRECTERPLIQARPVVRNTVFDFVLAALAVGIPYDHSSERVRPYETLSSTLFPAAPLSPFCTTAQTGARGRLERRL